MRAGGFYFAFGSMLEVLGFCFVRQRKNDTTSFLATTVNGLTFVAARHDYTV